MEIPTVKTNRVLKVLCSSCKAPFTLTIIRQILSAECTIVPLGLGALGLEFLIETNTGWRWYPILMRKKKDQVRIEILFIIKTLKTFLIANNYFATVVDFCQKSSESHLNFNSKEIVVLRRWESITG